MAYSEQQTPHTFKHRMEAALEMGRKALLHYGYAYIALKSRTKRRLMAWLPSMGTTKKTYTS